MKHLLYLMIWLTAAQPLLAQPTGAEEILARIHPPHFKKAAYTITDLGALPDGQTNCRAVLDSAITICSNNGGGMVRIPRGHYFVAGPIVLKSHVNLHLDDGAVITFSANTKDYLPPVLSRWEGTELYNYSPLIYAYHCSDIAITGSGMLVGSAGQGFAKWRPQGSAQQNKLRQWGIDKTPVYQRVFGDSSRLPPDMIQLFGCRNILIDSISITDAPYWVIHPVFCDNVTVQHVTINSMNLNNDGCDPESSSNVLIQYCHFTVGDDGIAIKAGRDQDGWRVGQPTENVVIRYNNFTSKTNGLCIGSEMSAGVRNVYMYQDTLQHCLSAIYFKSNLDRGGYIQHIRVNNIRCDSARSAFIRFENNYHGSRGGNHPTLFSDFAIRNARCRISGEAGIYAEGIKGHPLTSIFLRDISILHTPVPQVIDNTVGLRYSNVRINNKELQPVNTGIIRLHTD
jgi:polygalacturonase